MADTSSRMLQLLTLLQSNRDWSGLALADRLGVSDRRLRHLIGRIEITAIWNAWDLAAPSVHQDVLLGVSAA